MRRLLLPLLALTLSALTLTALALALAPATPPAPASLAPSAPAAAPLSPPALAWKPGHRYRYALTYTATQHLDRALAGDKRARIAGTAELALTWNLTPITTDPDGALIELHLADLDRHAIKLDGAPLLPDPATARETLTTPRAWLRYDPDGRLTALHFAPGTPSLFENLVQTLATEAEIILAPGAAWTTRQHTAHGATRSRYARHAEPDGWRIERSRDPYPALAALPDTRRVDLRATARARWRDGHLTALIADEALDATGAAGALTSRATLTLTLIDITPAPAPAPDLTALETRHPGQTTPSAAARRRALEARAEGLTLTALLTDLHRHGASGRLPDHNRWLWRATATLELDPTAAAALAHAFTDPATAPRARALIADLLASTATPAAQTALREALDSDAAHTDPDRGLLLQRLAFVDHPTPETIDWLRAELDGPHPLAAATALGSAIGRVAPSDPTRADTAHRELITALDATTDPADRAALLRALGNAGQPAALEAITPHATDPDPSVRGAAATALRAIDDPRATDLLAALAADPEATVQASALDAIEDILRAGRATPTLRDALPALAEHIAPDNHERLIGLLTRHGPLTPRARAALITLRAHATPPVRRTIDQALAQG